MRRLSPLSLTNAKRCRHPYSCKSLLHALFPGGALLPEDNHNRNQKESPVDTSAGSSMEVIEFNWPLYVYQRRARDGEEYLFTIAVWKGTRLLPICHLQPFQSALAALGNVLIHAGQSQSMSTASAGSDRNGLNTVDHEEARTDAGYHSSAAGDNGRS